MGELSLYDYLFTTAATLRDGLAASSRYLPLLTTNGRLRVESQSDRETTYSYAYKDADGRGADLALQLSVAVFCLRARAGTGRPVVPVHVAFAQDAPHSRRQFTEVLGTSQIDFGADRGVPRGRRVCVPGSCNAASQGPGGMEPNGHRGRGGGGRP